MSHDAVGEFSQIEHELPGLTNEVIASLVLANATYELVAAQRNHSRVIEEGIMYLVKHWPQS